MPAKLSPPAPGLDVYANNDPVLPKGRGNQRLKIVLVRLAIAGGVLQAFRRDQGDQLTRTFRLHGLLPSAEYETIDLDGSPPRRFGGRTWMADGLPVEIGTRPGGDSAPVPEDRICAQELTRNRSKPPELSAFESG